MKCPFCGRESRNRICDGCKAEIPAEKPKETKEEKDDESILIYKKRTRSE